MAFVVGDVVQLKSGGSTMTVEAVGPASEEISEGHVGCVWFEAQQGNALRRATFPVDSLEKPAVST